MTWINAVYLVAVALDGLALAYLLTGIWELISTRRTTRQALADLAEGEQLLAESRARFPEPYDGEIQLPDETHHSR